MRRIFYFVILCLFLTVIIRRKIVKYIEFINEIKINYYSVFKHISFIVGLEILKLLQAFKTLKVYLLQEN